MSFLKEYIGELDMNKVDDLENRIEILEKDKQNFPRNILRRDVNDLHMIIMLRDIARKIKKKDRIIFLGLGRVVHTFIAFKKYQKQGLIDKNIEVLFIPVIDLDEKLIINYGFGDDCIAWKYQRTLAMKILESKVVVLSSHILSRWGDCLLSACISDANIIQLWHGLPAKTIGASIITDNMDFHHFTRILNDCVSAKHVCIDNNLPDVIAEYSRAFPNAKLHITGNPMLDMLFDESKRQEFLGNKNSKEEMLLKKWLEENKEKKKILYCPTYRESAESTEKLLSKLNDLLEIKDFAILVKFHIATRITREQKVELEKKCKDAGHFWVYGRDEIYSRFNDFDAIITDYSSIRIDFAITGKPVILWQYDIDEYPREVNPVDLFNQVDRLSYYMSNNINKQDLLDIIYKDPMRLDRENFIGKIRHLLVDDSAKKTVDVILNVLQESNE